MKKYHKLVGLTQQKLSHSSGGQSPEIKEWVGSVSSEGCEGESVLALLPWLEDGGLLPASLHYFPSTCTCAYISFFVRTSVIPD